jgi:hypothetical protein
MNRRSSSLKWLLIAVGVALLGGALAYTVLSKPRAPDVRYVTLDGEATSTQDLQGKVVFVNGSIAQAFGQVRLTPTGVLIDKRGRILKRILGEPDWAGFHKLIEHELAA